MFVAGTLWDRLVTVSRQASESGALQPIETSLETVQDGGVPFAIRHVLRMPPKPTAQTDRPAGDRFNPFLPYDPALYVGAASPTHVCLLNKFNVVDHHLLIVTADFEHQETALTPEDFTAVWRCMPEFHGLAFYNSGAVAGASQAHKHLQIVPLPVGATPPSVPLEVLLATDRRRAGQVLRLPELPFAHAVVFWDEPWAQAPHRAAEASYAAYLDLLRQVGIGPSPTTPPRMSQPYNLLLHRRWMLIVPRRHECFHSISLNALAFAGALLVQTTRQSEQLKAAGPLAALQSVAPATQP